MPHDGDAELEPIPYAELQHLVSSIGLAHTYARAEQFLSGYLVLLARLLIVEQWQEPWIHRLTSLWEEALAEYREQYPGNWGDLD